MKLSKALKEKNKLVTEISKLSLVIRTKNSYDVSKKEEVLKFFDVFDNLNNYRELVSELVELKSLIVKYNEPIQNKIFLISELKSEITMLKSIPTDSGIASLGYGSTHTIEKEVQMNEVYINSQIKRLEEKIDELQEEIDMHNYNTEIPWSRKV